jgi:DNA primase
MGFSDASLDRLRHELLNLAASGFRLESGGLENHLVRKGMGELVARFGARSADGDPVPADTIAGGPEDRDARFLRAVASLREMADLEPERTRAVERFNDEPSAETWADAQRLLAGRTFSND